MIFLSTRDWENSDTQTVMSTGDSPSTKCTTARADSITRTATSTRESGKTTSTMEKAVSMTSRRLQFMMATSIKAFHMAREPSTTTTARRSTRVTGCKDSRLEREDTPRPTEMFTKVISLTASGLEREDS